MGFVEATAGSVEIGATAFWVGASAGFAFVQAPIAFHTIEDRDLFAQLTERTLHRLSAATFAAEGIASGCALLALVTQSRGRTSAMARVVAGLAAIGAVAYHERVIFPSMTEAQRAMGGSFAGIADDDPKRVAYNDLHEQSTRVFGGALLAGLVQLLLAANRPRQRKPS